MRNQSNIDRPKLWEQIKYTPHSEAQREFHESTARFRAPICGRRFGKSTMAGVDLVEACFIPDSYYWIVGPTYKLAEKEFRVVYKAFCDHDKLNLGKEIKKTYNAKQGDMSMRFPWGTTLECTSATNVDSLLGEGLDGVIMSEAARHSLMTWEQYIEPALSDKRGWATFPTTPRGYNWVQGMWQLGQLPDEPEYESWSYPTWLNTFRYPEGFDVNCPHIRGICKCNPELTRIWRRVSEAYWKQEYAASFTSFEGAIYEEFDPTIHVQDIAYNPEWRNFRVFDYGFADPFVCLDIMVDPSDNVYVWREYQVKGLSTWEHAHQILRQENPPGFHCDAMFGDPAGADEAATIALVIGYVVANKVGWPLGVEAVKRWLKLQPDGKPKLFVDRSCVHLIRQIQALRHKDIRDGHNAREGQHDWDDHGPDALRYFFSEYFVLGGGSSLEDIYDASEFGSEAQTFFKNNSTMKLDRGLRL